MKIYSISSEESLEASAECLAHGGQNTVNMV